MADKINVPTKDELKQLIEECSWWDNDDPTVQGQLATLVAELHKSAGQELTRRQFIEMIRNAVVIAFSEMDDPLVQVTRVIEQIAPGSIGFATSLSNEFYQFVDTRDDGEAIDDAFDNMEARS